MSASLAQLAAASACALGPPARSTAASVSNASVFSSHDARWSKGALARADLIVGAGEDGSGSTPYLARSGPSPWFVSEEIGLLLVDAAAAAARSAARSMTRAATAALGGFFSGLDPTRVPSLLPSPPLLPTVDAVRDALDDAGSESARPSVDVVRLAVEKSLPSSPKGSTGETGADACPSLDPGTRTAAGLPPRAGRCVSWLV